MNVKADGMSVPGFSRVSIESAPEGVWGKRCQSRQRKMLSFGMKAKCSFQGEPERLNKQWSQTVCFLGHLGTRLLGALM